MGTTATVIAVAYTLVSVVAIIVVLLVVRSTRGREPDLGVDTQALRETERTWFVAVVVLLAAVLFATIFFIPYGRSASAGAQIVDVQAVQFAWLIPSRPIKAGRQVEFRLTSKDVNHSFAVYTQSGELLFQVQVMPDEVQKYVYTFSKPGLYRVVCLEYCGVDHDKMQGELKVVR
jgi:cytochrome c oxidase subunit 2